MTKIQRILFSERTYRSSNKWSCCYLRSDVKPLRTNGGRFWASQILCRIEQFVFVHIKQDFNASIETIISIFLETYHMLNCCPAKMNEIFKRL